MNDVNEKTNLLHRRTQSLLRITGTAIPIFTAIITIVSLAILVILSIQFYGDIANYFDSIENPTSMITELKGIFQFFFGVLVYTVISIGFILFLLFIYLFLPGLLVGPVAFLPALIWRCPHRFLVLRRFHRDDSSRGIKQALRRYVSPFGHVYTLADEDIKVPWYVRFPIILTQLAFFQFRRKVIRSERGIQKLLAAMEIRWVRNVNWMISWSKIFPIYSKDAVWQQCVQAMANNVDVVIIDISELSKNIIWEMERLWKEGLSGKTIFFTTSKKRHESMVRVQDAGLINLIEGRLVVYDSDDQDMIIRAVRGVIAESGQVIVDQKQLLPTFIRVSAPTRAIIQMIGPFISAGIILLSLWLIWLKYDELKIPTRVSTFESKIEDEDSRASGFNALINILKRKQTEDWRKNFDKMMIPLFENLWNKEPRWQTQILEVLRDAKHPAGSPFWERALSLRSGPHLQEKWELALEGIRNTYPRNIADSLIALLKYLSEGSYPSVDVTKTQLDIIKTLSILRDENAVPTILKTLRANHRDLLSKESFDVFKKQFLPLLENFLAHSASDEDSESQSQLHYSLINALKKRRQERDLFIQQVCSDKHLLEQNRDNIEIGKQRLSVGEIEKKVKRIISEKLKINQEGVYPGSHLVNDLGADSLDLVELIMSMEEEFDIDIPDDDAEKILTVQNAIDYLTIDVCHDFKNIKNNAMD